MAFPLFSVHRATLPPKITQPPPHPAADPSPPSLRSKTFSFEPCIQPSILPSISPPIHPSIYSFHPFFPSTNPSTNQSTNPSTHIPIQPPARGWVGGCVNEWMIG